MIIDMPRFRVQMPDGRLIEDAGQAVAYLEDALEDIRDAPRGLSWQAQPGGAGWAIVQLFGRLLELTTHRFDQVPEKHFLAFLNQAGIDLLASRAAGAELTFFPAEEGPAFIRVPAGTQVATIQTEFAPEVIFETQRDIVVVPNQLVKCISFDPVGFSDRSKQAAGSPAGAAQSTAATGFAAFKGDKERDRILYLGDSEIFKFSDDASRNNAVITLRFGFDTPGDPDSDGWELEWIYLKDQKWEGIVDAGATVTDGTGDFSQNNKTVKIQNLPAMVASSIDAKDSIWLGCRLTGGNSREHIPAINDIKISREIIIESFQIATVDAAFSAVQANSAFVPLDLSTEFQPFGPVPGRMDSFYIRADGVFSKSNVTAKIEMDHLDGTPAEATSDALSDLTLEWEIFSSSGWTHLGTSKRSTATNDTFQDTTGAFTNSNGDENNKLFIEFEVPEDTAPTQVNDQQGYWIRARMAEGGYSVPSDFKLIKAETLQYEFIEAHNYAPFIRNMQISYTDYESSISADKISFCLSLTDQDYRDHTQANDSDQTFKPFQATDQGPGLYLGFQKAFAPGQWIQLLLDVIEEQSSTQNMPPVLWEYATADDWKPLQTADGSKGLRQRGYLGFSGPADQQARTAFGQSAYWLRTRPVPPKADAGDDQSFEVSESETSVTLDALQSRSFDPKRTIASYFWRLLESDPPRAEAGDDQIVRVPLTATEGTVTLDASASVASPARPIVRYLWRIADSEEEEKLPPAVPYLKTIRINTVPTVNTVTLNDEVLGAGNGKHNQSFSLTGAPVYPGARIAVREPDRPPDDELAALKKNLQLIDPAVGSPILPDDPSPETGVWVRWHQVTDFYQSGPASRHFTLDLITGEIQFGDGRQGKIPPVGRDNIKAVQYRIHDGAAGNTKAGTITTLRNPSGALADIKSVTNPEASAGGSDAETAAEVKRHGPRRLKSRNRIVTFEDFEALAREASGEVANARCLPARNPAGIKQEGWVTVVVLPKSSAARPTPGPALIRTVRKYLEDRALTNLTDINRIYVRGPEYVKASVKAQVVPRKPEKADEVELTVLKRLENFLHPLRGGPHGNGWELGRNVYQSEVYAEIEAIVDVDHVAGLTLQGSLQQYRMVFQEEAAGFRTLPFDVPAQSQASTFDDRIKLVVAEPVVPAGGQIPALEIPLRQIDLYGFNVGDRLNVVSAGNRAVKTNLTIARLEDRKIYFNQPFDEPVNWALRDALRSEDGRIRLPLTADAPELNKNGKISGLTFTSFAAGDQISIVVGGKRHPRLEFIPVATVSATDDRIFTHPGHLVYSGTHDIDMVLA